MSSIFSIEDIQELLTTYSLTDKAKDLTRTASGDAFITYDALIRELKDLIDTANLRVSKDSLCARLNITEQALTRLLARVEDTIVLSTDSGSILPGSDVRKLVADIQSQSRENCVDLRKIVRDKDISLSSLDRFVKHQFGNELLYVKDTQNGLRYVCHPDHASSIVEQVRHVLAESQSNRYDLGGIAPALVLQALAAEVISNSGLELTQDGVTTVVTRPSTDGHDNDKAGLAVDALVETLEVLKYCLIEQANSDDLVKTIVEQYKVLGGDAQGVQVLVKSSDTSTNQRMTSLLIQTTYLQELLETLQTEAETLLRSKWNELPRPVLAATIVAEVARASMTLPEQSIEIVLNTPEGSDVRSVIKKETENFLALEKQQIKDITSTKLFIPLTLYDIGLASIQDETLLKHLEDHLLGHFRLEIIPQTMTALEQAHLLLDKPRQRDTNKFKQASNEAKYWSTLRTAVNKYSKKLDIGETSPDSVNEIRIKTLQNIVRSLPRVTRGSDVLQNLIWMCLASCTKGLFMSSGKDTSRMIKAYEQVGDYDIVDKLKQWRDMLKAGNETREDIQEMRELAMRIFEED